MQELDDNALLRKYVDLDSEEAFAELVARHVNKVYSVALRHTNNPSQAEEITQAVFVILARKARTLGRRVILSGWLYQTARLTAVTLIRSQIRRAQREQEAYMQAVTHENEADTWTQIAPLLDKAMARLNDTDRHAVVLRYFDGKSLGEIGAALGSNAGAVEKRVSRALEKLRKFFVKRGVVIPAAVLAATLSAHSVQAAPATLAKSVTVVALAKGMAAGGPAFALVKGALKLMAWHNAKAAIITSVAIVVAAGTTPFIVQAVNSAAADPQPDITGTWETTEPAVWFVPELRFDLHVVLKISKTNGTYRAVTDLIELGQTDYPAPTFTYKLGVVRLLYLWGSYEGTVDPTGKELRGSFLNGRGYKTELVWKRTTHPDVPPPRLAASDYAPSEKFPMQGFWEGHARINGVPVRMNLKIAEPAPGSFRAELDYLDVGLQHVPVTISYDQPNVGLTCLGAELDGTLNASNTEFRGTIPASSPEISWSFKRAHPEPAGDFSSTSGADLPGHWRGTVNLGGYQLPLTLHIAQLPDGKYSTTLDNHFDGFTGALATATRYGSPQVRIEWVWLGCSFEGELKGSTLSGVWSGSGVKRPVVFQRNDLP